MACAQLSADYPEDARLYWEPSERRCPHGETQAERNQAGEPGSGVRAAAAPEAEGADPDGGEDKTPEQERREEELELTVASAEEAAGGLMDHGGTVRRRNKRRKAKKPTAPSAARTKAE